MKKLPPRTGARAERFAVPPCFGPSSRRNPLWPLTPADGGNYQGDDARSRPRLQGEFGSSCTGSHQPPALSSRGGSLLLLFAAFIEYSRSKTKKPDTCQVVNCLPKHSCQRPVCVAPTGGRHLRIAATCPTRPAGCQSCCQLPAKTRSRNRCAAARTG